MSYPNLSSLNYVTDPASAYYTGVAKDDAMAAPPPVQREEPSAPYCPTTVNRVPAKVSYVVKKSEIQQFLDGHACGVCDESLCRRANESFVFFGVCSHGAHLSCVSSLLAEGGGAARGLDGGDESLCARCASDALARDDAGRGAPHANRVYRDRDELLANFKAMYRKENKFGPSYEELKNEPLSIAEQRELLRAPAAARSAIMAIAPAKIINAASSFVQRARGKGIEPAESDGDDDEDRVTSMLREGLFAQCAWTLKRTYDDMIASKNGSLLAVYRAGVRTMNDLRYIGFDPLRHLTAAYRTKAPAWQLCDLYNLTFAQLMQRESEGGMGMTMRVMASSTALRPGEWALLGADVPKLLSLGMSKREMKQINMRVDRWQRYMLLERAHLTALGITNYEHFVHEMKWDAAHEWCPASDRKKVAVPTFDRTVLQHTNDDESDDFF